MRLGTSLELVSQYLLPSEFQTFRGAIEPEWIEEALAATGTASVRRRRLPAAMVVWLVIGMALMRNESMERLVVLLGLSLPSSKGRKTARSAITQARQRLGEEPLAYLYTTTADHWAGQSAAAHTWRGLKLYGADGTTLRVPDSPENWKAFGGQCGNGRRNGSAYPMVRLVGLMVVRSHLLSAVRFADYATGEATLAKDLYNELPDDALLIEDRAFLIAQELTALERSGHNRHWLTRAKSTTRLRVVKHLGPGDDLVEIQLSPATRKKYPELPALWLVRAITYQRKGFRPSTLLTSLLLPNEYPASEIIGLYHERWELELGYDEVKTHLLDRVEAIRSRTPEGVRQELWGIALAYNLIRLQMERTAAAAGIAPTRISFVNALSLIKATWLAWSMPPLAPGRIPDGLAVLQQHLALLLLPERRSERAYPRAVKIKMSAYNRKPPTGNGRK